MPDINFPTQYVVFRAGEAQDELRSRCPECIELGGVLSFERDAPIKYFPLPLEVEQQLWERSGGGNFDRESLNLLARFISEEIDSSEETIRAELGLEQRASRWGGFRLRTRKYFKKKYAIMIETCSRAAEEGDYPDIREAVARQRSHPVNL